MWIVKFGVQEMRINVEWYQIQCIESKNKIKFLFSLFQKFQLNQLI